MSTVTRCLLCMLLGCIVYGSTEPQCECVSDNEVQQMKNALEMKDKQIEHLTKQLNELKSEQKKITQPELSDDYSSNYITCNAVPKELHLKYGNQCIHECIQPHSCSHIILSCYPYNNCIIKCIGAVSCHHLQIDFIKGATSLECNGFNSCKGIILNAQETYTFPQQTINKSNIIKKRYVADTVESFFWFLPNLIFDLQDIVEFNDDNIILNPHYILAKNACSNDMLDKIKMSQKICYNADHTEHRRFGDGEQYDVSGHQVTYLDDCIHHEVYAFAKSVTVGMLKYVQKYTVNKLKEMNISNNMHGIHEYISNNWLYDWQIMVSLANDLESRVIEYIEYHTDGNLGYHTDDGSNITMVTMVNDADSFKGGILKFRLNIWDQHVYKVKLEKNDIIIFPSIAEHAITRISDGERHVLVFEWWDIGRSDVTGRTKISDHLHNMAIKGY